MTATQGEKGNSDSETKTVPPRSIPFHWFSSWSTTRVQYLFSLTGFVIKMRSANSYLDAFFFMVTNEASVELKGGTYSSLNLTLEKNGWMTSF